MKVKFFQKKKVDGNEKELFLITFVLPRRSISVEKLKKKKKEKVEGSKMQYRQEERIRTR